MPQDNTLAMGHGLNQIEMTNNWVIARNGRIANPPCIPLKKFFSQLRQPVDPKVIYDPEKRRFIAFAQEADAQRRFGPWHVAVAVSNSENPIGQWTFYQVNLKNGESFDYPKVALTRAGFFVSGTMYGSSMTAVVCQFDIQQAYDRQDMDYLEWRSFSDETLFTLPVHSGGDSLSGPGCFLLSVDWRNPATLIRLMHIRGDVHSSSNGMDLWLVPREANAAYRYYRKADQKDDTVPVWNLDLRIMDGFQLAGNIVFAFMSGDINQRSMIDLNVLHLDSLRLESRLVGDRGRRSYCFPSVSWMRTPGNDTIILTQYNSVGPDAFADLSCKACQWDLSACWAELSMAAATSKGPVLPDPFFGHISRLGDYSCISRVPDDPGQLLLSSSLPRNDTLFTTWTCRVGADTTQPLAAALPEPTFLSYPLEDVDATEDAGAVRITVIGSTGRTILYSGEIAADIKKLNIYTPQGLFSPDDKLLVTKPGLFERLDFSRTFEELFADPAPAIRFDH